MIILLFRKKTLSLFFLFIGVQGFRSLEAYEIHHIIRPFSNFETAATNNVCGTLKSSRLAIHCNPALFPYTKNKHIGLNMLGKSEGKSIENTRELLFSKIEPPFLKKLFSLNSFSSFTLNSNIELHTPYFLLTYSPYYILADFLIINPVFPEIALALYKRSTLKFAHGREISSLIGLRNWDLSLGGSISGHTQEGTNTSFSLLELSETPTKYLIQFEKSWGFLGDVGLYFGHKEYLYIPRFSITVKNIGPQKSFNPKGGPTHRMIRVREVFEMYSQLGLGEELETKMGSFFAGVDFTFLSLFQTLKWPPSFSGKYTLGPFSAYVGASNFSKTAGLIVSSKNTAIGLLYGREKEIRNFNVEEDHSVYIGMELRTP